MPVKIVWDDLRLAEKFQSSQDIAGSPRNSFRASVNVQYTDGRALYGLGAFTGYRTLTNSECRIYIIGSQTV